jgi:hypothetical protein
MILEEGTVVFVIVQVVNIDLRSYRLAVSYTKGRRHKA